MSTSSTDRKFDHEEIWEESVATVEPGTYRIVNANSGKMLKVVNRSTSVGANVQQGRGTTSLPAVDRDRRWEDWRVSA